MLARGNLALAILDPKPHSKLPQRLQDFSEAFGLRISRNVI